MGDEIYTSRRPTIFRDAFGNHYTVDQLINWTGDPPPPPHPYYYYHSYSSIPYMNALHEHYMDILDAHHKANSDMCDHIMNTIAAQHHDVVINGLKYHIDPAQTINLMNRHVEESLPDGKATDWVDLAKLLHGLGDHENSAACMLMALGGTGKEI